jgi:ribosomal protein S1
LWSFLAMSNKERGIVERRMIRVLETDCPLPFTIIHLDKEKAILSRTKALEKLAVKVRLAAGQEVPVTVLLTSAHGAWCEHRGLNVLVPRDEVYYGDVSPREMLEPGRTYMARIFETGEIIRASTRVLEPDPWESFSCRPGSVRRATLRGQLREGNNRFRVSFAPGISGVAQGAPLSTYHNNQVVNVRIIKVIAERRFILGRIEE